MISGNRGNGITIEGDDNIVQADYIGTDTSGDLPIANRGNGIQITAGAANNLIGGLATGGNDPTGSDPNVVRPPQGNLVSGNRGNGVLIDDGATGNQLSGNFIGTAASGDSALGNRGDGVAIVNADGNLLIGTTSEQNPFVYYNVVSGNFGNGLRVTNSDHIVVHANFFGIGANNSTAVANRGDGMLVNGDSEHVDSGGEIPLGNVMSGNTRYGMEIAGTAGGVVSFNNFVGQAAFGTTPLSNWAGGIRVTSSNPNFDPGDEYSWNRIRTSLVGGNRGNGIEFLGNAYGAEVTDTAVGTDSSIRGAIPNYGNGIVVGGNASHIAIGGFQPSVEEAGSNFSVYVGASRGYGIVFKGNAHDNFVFDTRVGLGGGATVITAKKLPNLRGGILLGRGTSNITIGGQRDALNPGLRYFNEIASNYGNGITVRSSSNLKLLGNTIADNKASGVVLMQGRGRRDRCAVGRQRHHGQRQVWAIRDGESPRNHRAVLDSDPQWRFGTAARVGPRNHGGRSRTARGEPDVGQRRLGHPRLRLEPGIGADGQCHDRQRPRRAQHPVRLGSARQPDRCHGEVHRHRGGGRCDRRPTGQAAGEWMAGTDHGRIAGSLPHLRHDGESEWFGRHGGLAVRRSHHGRWRRGLRDGGAGSGQRHDVGHHGTTRPTTSAGINFGSSGPTPTPARERVGLHLHRLAGGHQQPGQLRVHAIPHADRDMERPAQHVRRSGGGQLRQLDLPGKTGRRRARLHL